MVAARLFEVLFTVSLVFLPSPLLHAQEGKALPKKEGKPPAGAKAEKDPQLAAIAKAMKALASKAVPIHMKIKMTAQLPFEDQPLVAEGELWAVGDKKLHYVMVIKPGRLRPTAQEIWMNSQGAWMRLPAAGKMVFFSADLVAKLKEAQKSGASPMAAPSARGQIDVLDGLKKEGFSLKWVGQKKLDGTVVDEILGTRVPPGRSGATMGDPEGKIDKVVLYVGAKDRIPRKIEWFAGKDRVRVQEFSDITVGKKIDDREFQVKLRPGEEVVNALDHPFIGPALKDILNKEPGEKKG